MGKNRDITEKERTLPAQPVGTIITYAGTDLPAGYLDCDASELSETVYSALFAKLQTAWNTTGGVAPPAVGNFRLPPSNVGDRGVYFRGEGLVNGAVGTYQEDVLKSHSHNITYYSGGDSAHSHSGPADIGSRATDSNTLRTEISGLTGDATETRPLSITVKYCIKY